MDPATVLLGIGSKVIDKLWPDQTQANAAKLKLLEMQANGDLAQLAGQLEINKAEAANTSVLVSGWRPSIGWVCSAALAYHYICRPLLQFGFAVAGHPLPPLPGIDDNLWQLMLGMLGLGGLRTFEKAKGVA